jgi:hypothetical protein
MKILFPFFKVLLSICLFQSLAVFAATEAQIMTLIDNLELKKAITTQVIEINRYEIEKRSPQQTPQQKEQLLKLVAYIESQLEWKEIGPDLITQYSLNFDEKKITVINNFLNTPAGKVYKDQYQYMALPYKIMLDEYVNELIETFFDDPNASLPKVSLTSQQEKQAYELITLLMDDSKKYEFNTSQKYLNEIVQKGTKANKKQMNNFNDSFSLVQINSRTAKVLSEKISPEDIKLLLVAVKDKKVQNALKILDVSGTAYSNYLQQKFMLDQEFLALIQKTLEPSSSD